MAGVHRLRRSAYVAATVLAFVVVVASVVAIWTVRQPFPQTDGEIDVPGLNSDVRVLRDEYGVPQIYADNAEDLFRAQGFVQAQDRFFEMDFRRHATSGRLTEMFGQEALETDMFVRTMGWHEVAEQEFALLDPDTRRYLESFSSGVNAYLAERSPSEISLEYAVLDLGGLEYTPEEWTPVDSLAWLKAMAWDLRSNMGEEIDRVLASTVLTKREIADLYPDYPVTRHEPVVQEGAVVDGVYQQDGTQNAPSRPARAALSPEAVDALNGLKRASGRLPDLLGTGNGIGSNAWAVSGERTSTGMPLLANDPHLAPTMPGIWYQMGLHCTTITADCPFDVSGYTFAGLPGVVIGHNRQIAWGFTNLKADVADLYLERVGSSTYQYGDRRLPLRQRRERFVVPDGEDVSITVSSTRHGPLVSDVDEQLGEVAAIGAKGTVPQKTVGTDGVGDAVGGDDMEIALRWTALDPGRTADAIFGMNAAGSWTEFRHAARDFEVPAQNLVYADAGGHIGYQTPGHIPIRRTGNGDWPALGWDPSYDWAKSHIPFEALPSVLDPPRGYVVSANQAVVGPTYPFYLGDSWAYGYRSQRIVELIRDDLSLTVGDMGRLQLDSRNGNAKTLVPYLLDVNVHERYVQHGQRTLRDWNFSQPEDSAGAAYFNVVWRNLLAMTFHDQLPRSVWPDGDGQWFEVVRNLLDDPASPWWDDVRTDDVQETRDDILEAAMTAARYEMARQQARDPRLWTWGHLHRLELVHQSLGTSGVGLVEWMFNRGPFEVAGGDSVVNATGWSAPQGYDVDFAPSMRMVVSLADLNQSRWVNLTGASGHAYHPHYNDQFPHWLAGETTPWAFGRHAVAESAVDELRLVPAAAGAG
ncbi:MAG: penicillin acylase family protein [Nocardioidaceae bacterium]